MKSSKVHDPRDLNKKLKESEVRIQNLENTLEQVVSNNFAWGNKEDALDGDETMKILLKEF